MLDAEVDSKFCLRNLARVLPGPYDYRKSNSWAVFLRKRLKTALQREQMGYIPDLKSVLHSQRLGENLSETV